MPVLPEEVLEKLKCSFCNKYLSVFPVKVYHNKKLLCGRCEDTNGGTTSRFYELVASQLEFPCINRFEGCKEILPAPDMEEHETTCQSDEYVCPMCPDFSASAYDLLHHMNVNHKRAALENMNFLIEMDRGSNSEIYFYCRNPIFVVVNYVYDVDVQQLALSLDVFGKHRTTQQNVMHQFWLYSVQNDLQYRTGKIRSSQSGFGDENYCKIDVSTQAYTKNIIFVKFQIYDSTVLMPKYHRPKKHVDVQCDFSPIMGISSSKRLLIFRFEGVSKLQENIRQVSVSKYWVGDRVWKLSIERRINKTDAKKYLAVYLWQEKYNDVFQPCHLISTVTLTSTDFRHNRTLVLNKKNFEEALGPYTFLQWEVLVDPLKGYLKNDTVKFYVSIEVLPSDEIKCEDCHSQPTCSTCQYFI